MNEAMTEDWASRLAMQIHGLTPDQESVVAQFLRDERSRAAEKCKSTSVYTGGFSTEPQVAAWHAGLADTRRDIATAIKGE